MKKAIKKTIKKELVFVDSNNLNEEPFTTSKIIAECGEVQHHTVTKLIQNYEKDLKELGIVRFEIDKPINGIGRPEIFYKLNEEQATLLITYMRNTEPVRTFKKALVKQFFKMRNELEKRAITRAVAKDARNALTDAINLLPDSPHKKFKYKQYTELVYKTAFGINTKELKIKLDIPMNANLRDYLTEVQLKKIQKIENQVASLVELGYEYKDIKEILKKKYSVPVLFIDVSITG